MKCAAATGPEGFENRGDSAELRVVIIRDAMKTLPRAPIDMQRGVCKSLENKSHENISMVRSMSTSDSLFYKTKLDQYHWLQYHWPPFAAPPEGHQGLRPLQSLNMTYAVV